MPAYLSEHVLKGAYLGLLLFVAFQQPSASGAAVIAGCLLLGLGACLAAALVRRHTMKPECSDFGSYLLFLLLENSTLVYWGIFSGLAAAMLVLRIPERSWLLAPCMGGGAGLGVLMLGIPYCRKRVQRAVLSLVLLIGLLVGAYFSAEVLENLLSPGEQAWAGLQFLVGMPFFHVLVLSGRAEESEADWAVLCGAKIIGVWLLLWNYPVLQAVVSLVLLSVSCYALTRILPDWRVVKHTLRGIGYVGAGRMPSAMSAFRHALHLDPGNARAQAGLWELHQKMEVQHLNAEVLGVLDVDMCLERAAVLLASTPSEEQLGESMHLLDLVAAKRPEARCVVDYWRSVAWTHGKDLDQAVVTLNAILDPAQKRGDDSWRESILFSAWQLALVLHPELRRRVGLPQLNLPGRRMEAIAAVERRLSARGDDAEAWDLKRLLYSELRETDLGNGPTEISVEYLHQLGLALLAEPARLERGVEYLRMAARLDPSHGPLYFKEIAEARTRGGDESGAWAILEEAMAAARTCGKEEFTEEARHVYYSMARQLAERLYSQGAIDGAIENYQIFAGYERSGLETRRALAELYETKGDVLQAARATEQGLVYAPDDADLQARKDRYYYSIMPAQLEKVPQSERGFLDVGYCQRKARAMLDRKELDAEMLDWARHLAELACVLQPASVMNMVLLARCRRRAGDVEGSRVLLEEAHRLKPGGFASGDEEEAWYSACRMLGDLFLFDLQQPEQAVPYFQEYRKSSKSGADTIYKLGQAYERMGEHKRAAGCYEQVTSYETHPLAPEAREALYRLRT